MNNFLYFENTIKASNKKNWKDKKYCYYQNLVKKKANSNILTININAVYITRPKKDVFRVICYNCNKKLYYSQNYAKSRKNNSLKNY